MNIQKYITEAHDNAIEKGFYATGENKNIGELLMLIVSELGEALEAHRKGRFCHPKTRFFHENGELDNMSFNLEIKDTFEDEIADTFIRLFDLCGYLGIEPEIIKIKKVNYIENVGEVLLLICGLLAEMHIDPDGEKVEYLSDIINTLLFYCDKWDIPIEKHIIAKMAYNKTRPHKHGKAY